MTKNRMPILLGCDPEVFVAKEGRLIPAAGLIPGTKKEPFKVDRGAVQVDGCALEFNIDPAANVDEWLGNIRTVLGTMSAMVTEHELVIQPVAIFEPALFDAAPEEAKELGCDPDFNAWTGMANDRPAPPEELRTMRTAAGHIHIGWTADADVNDPGHRAICERIVKQLDFYLGLPSLLWDDDTQRRAMYGGAGAYRPKPYGVEYRVLSNRWLLNDELAGWVYGTTIHAVNGLRSGDKYLPDQYGEEVRDIIARSDRRAAVKLMDAAYINFPRYCSEQYNAELEA